MVQPVMSRSQRRVEKKQTWIIVVLVLLVAGVSFFLGVMAGQKGVSLPGFGDAEVQEVRMPPATQVVPVPPTPEPVPEPEPAKLTFYDNLPKGDQVPLGSGINLPPEQTASAAVPKPSTPEQPAVKPKIAKPVAQPKPAIPVSVPTATANGGFVVQIASFRTAEDASKYQARLGKQGLTTYQERADLGAKGVWFRVIAGPYAERTAADQVATLLKEKERVSALVRKR